MNYSNQQHQTIILKCEKQIRQFYVDQIMYISGNAYISTIHLANTEKPEAFSVLLKQLEERLLPFGFLRINRNELLNMRYFKRMRKNESRKIVLHNDQELTVSYRKVSSIKQFFLNPPLI